MTQKERISDFVRDLLDNELPETQCAMVLGNAESAQSTNNYKCNNYEAVSCASNDSTCTNHNVCALSTNNYSCTSYQKPNTNFIADKCLKV